MAASPSFFAVSAGSAGPSRLIFRTWRQVLVPPFVASQIWAGWCEWMWRYTCRGHMCHLKQVSPGSPQTTPSSLLQPAPGETLRFLSSGSGGYLPFLHLIWREVLTWKHQSHVSSRTQPPVPEVCLLVCSLDLSVWWVSGTLPSVCVVCSNSSHVCADTFTQVRASKHLKEHYGPHQQEVWSCCPFLWRSTCFVPVLNDLVLVFLFQEITF